jgi:hypothetical protein
MCETAHMTTKWMRDQIKQRLAQIRAELAASLAHEKTIDEAPPSTWDACPAQWMARRSWALGYRRRCGERRMLRRKIRTFKAALSTKMPFTDVIGYRFDRSVVREVEALKNSSK